MRGGERASSASCLAHAGKSSVQVSAIRAMSGRDIMTRPVWDILTEHGGRSIVLNVPTTYPPEPINVRQAPAPSSAKATCAKSRWR